jgi:hypothetical protein
MLGHAVTHQHTYITLSFESDIPISVVIENTGDKLATILQFYTKPSPSFIKSRLTKSRFSKPSRNNY